MEDKWEKKHIPSFELRVSDVAAILHVEEAERELSKLEDECAKPDFWNNPDNAKEVSKAASILREKLSRYYLAQKLLNDAQEAFELAGEEPDFYNEAQQLLTELDEVLDSLEIASLFTGKFDNNAAIITVNPGQGGLEAQDWTEMLFTMLTRYADKKSWKVHVLETVPGEGIGMDRAMFQVDGPLAYGMLRSENGIHRLVRISPTDAKARRHTTFASVEVLPVLPDNADVNIQESDVRVDVYRSSGPGGQCVNTTDSAVRLTHIPTGIVVTCQNEKSQLMNKEAAFRVLRSRLYELELEKREAQVNEIRGDRSENTFGSQIRSYVLYPYQLVKDLRSGVESNNVDAVLNGDLEPFVVGFHKWRAKEITR